VNREEQLQRNIGKDAISIAGTSLSSKCVVALEKQVTRVLRAAYEYFSKYAWYSRSDVGLPGFASYFYHSSNEEKLHAKQVVEYLLLRDTCNPIGFEQFLLYSKTRGILLPKQCSIL